MGTRRIIALAAIAASTLCLGAAKKEQAAKAPEVKVVHEREAIYAYLRGAVWVTVRPDGQLSFHDCADPDRLRQELAGANWHAAELVEQMADVMSDEFALMLEPVKREFMDKWRILDMDDPSKEFRRLAHARIQLNSLQRAHLARALLQTQLPAGESMDLLLEGPVDPTLSGESLRKECTEGRCDCGYCAPDRLCDCKTWNVGTLDCASPRRSCNTDDPKPVASIFPDLTYGY